METIGKLKIFLVDDDPFCTSVYQQHLGNLGYADVTSFSNGADCLNNLTLIPDVIFLDHGMDNLTGIEVLKKIKRFNPDIYIVFLSGQADIKTAVNALKFGGFDYIVKGTHELENMIKVLDKIMEVKKILKKKKPIFLKKLF